MSVIHYTVPLQIRCKKLWQMVSMKDTVLDRIMAQVVIFNLENALLEKRRIMLIY